MVLPQQSKTNLSPEAKAPSEKHKTLVLIDGHALAYRMYFALETTNMKTKDNKPTWAIYGFFNALFLLLQSIKPDAMAVSFDLDSDTFRKQLYADYKAHRQAMPDALRQQMDGIKEGVRLLGMPIYERQGFEADDVIGTLASKAREEGWWVKILTGDQDSFQLVKDADETHLPIQVLIPPRTPRDGLKTYDRAAVFEKLGVYPEQVIDYKGFRGDTSDNIPGIPGVGEKTAVKLLSEYETMENVYAHLAQMPKNKLLEKLSTYQEQAELSKRLATIDEAVPIDVKFDDCHLEIPDWEALTAFFEQCEFKAFLRQAPTLLAPFASAKERLSVASSMTSNAENAVGQELVLKAHVTEETAPTALIELKDVLQVEHTIVTEESALKAFLARVETTGIFAIDIETTGLDIFQSDLVGIALSVADGLALEIVESLNPLHLSQYPKQSFRLNASGKALEKIETVYVPLAHSGEDNIGIAQLSEATVLELLRPLLLSDTVCKIAHNAKFEVNFFKKLGILWQGPILDTMLASYIENPEGRHGLKNLGFQHCNFLMREIKELIGSGKKEIPFSEVELIQAAAYASCDTFVTLTLMHLFTQRFNQSQNPQKKWALLSELEMPVALVLAELERNGVSLDLAYLKSLSEMLEKKLSEVEQKIYQAAGGEFNINSPKQVGEVLFDRLNIQPLKKTKGKTGFSTDVKVLEMLSGEHPVIDLILEYRQLFKLKSTYIDALPQLVNPVTGRLHTSFNQAVAATGRLSSSNPNLQNIPIRTELGREIRRAFIPKDPKNWKLLSADYSQIELRLLAHFSEDPNLIAAFNAGEDIHQATAALVFGLDSKAVTKEMRYKAKAVNFGVVYGQSAHGLSQQLKIPRAEAAEFIERYFFKYKNVKNFIESVKAQAHRTGEVETISGRTRNLSEGLKNANRSIREFSERAAFNTPLQGSAADLIKVAMVRLSKRLKKEGLKSQLILQVHDELVLEVPDGEIQTVTALVKWAMELDQPLRVPLVVDISVGDSWLES
ncbi:MAG: DNA polymerase I [Vampirovibrionales bacterium]|nr:DNA polymerase I [Vampirovibrionales bacterium]